MKDEDGATILKEENEYVPGTLCPKDDGYGDYIIMQVDEFGKIDGWKFDIEDFIQEY